MGSTIQIVFISFVFLCKSTANLTVLPKKTHFLSPALPRRRGGTIPLDQIQRIELDQVQLYLVDQVQRLWPTGISGAEVVDQVQHIELDQVQAGTRWSPAPTAA